DDGPDRDGVTGILSCPVGCVRERLAPGGRAYLRIINGPDECVMGGEREEVEALAAGLGERLVPVTGVTVAHCEAVRPVEAAYRELHRLPTVQPPGVRFYSGAWGRSYEVTTDSAADAITGHARATLDFPRLVEAAYRDGVRLFVEVGPGASCSRMIGRILGDRPHLARSACVRGQDPVSTVLRTLGHLFTEGVPVDLGALYGRP